jgi:hypothetical protein
MEGFVSGRDHARARSVGGEGALGGPADRQASVGHSSHFTQGKPQRFTLSHDITIYFLFLNRLRINVCDFSLLLTLSYGCY